MTTFALPVLQDISNPAFTAKLKHKIDNKTKPLGSLGQLEGLALQLGQILGTESPQLAQPQMLVFAGDHGLTARGVSAFPSDVTWQMVENFIAGGACVSVLAKANNIALNVVDCGVNHEFLDATQTPRTGLLSTKIANGTADSSAAAAMTAAQCQQAIENGIAVVKNLPGNAILLGEMGIGNTTPSAALISLFTGRPATLVTGRGTGIDDPTLATKIGVIDRAVERARGIAGDVRANEPVDATTALAEVGGLEHASIAGFIIGGAAARVPVIIDGVIATSALLAAHAIAPGVLPYVIAGHRSVEPGASAALDHLGLVPLIDLDLRLGEGTGAVLAIPIVQAAARILGEMATFDEAGVTDKDPAS